jgi:RNA polymerase sigma-70 factor (sigma-E family)
LVDTFDEVFAAHHDTLVRLAGLLTGNRAVAEDVVADAFARTYPKWKRGHIDDVGAYLRRAVVNETNAVFRRRKRPVMPEPAVTDSHEAAIVEHERVWREVLALAPRQRAVLVLRFWMGMSERETAETLGIALGTVKSATSRALVALRTSLADEEGTREHA